MDNKEKMENLVDELYIMHKDSGERILRFTSENQRILNNINRTQGDMEELVREEMTKVSNKNDIFTTIMFFAFVIAAGLIIYSTISMKNKVNSYTELVARQSNKLYELASDMNYVMNELYKEQKEFLKENKCNVVEKKESAGVSKKVNIK
jgi:hypothetical protein